MWVTFQIMRSKASEHILSSIATMSMKASKQHLPPELWLRIFELATYVPGLLETDIPDPFDMDPPSILHLHQEYDRKLFKYSMVTKRSIVLVCRTWYSLALPLLYQVLYIPSRDSTGSSSTRFSEVVSSLLKRFIDSKHRLDPAGADDSRHRYVGLWPRRLELHFSAYNPIEDADVQRLIELSACLPNLEILAASGPFTEPPSVVLETILACSGASLRKIFLPQCNLQQKDGVAILESCPRLRALYVGYAQEGLGASCFVNWMRAPELSFFTIGVCSPSMLCDTEHDVSSIPSLQQVCFSSHSYQPVLDTFTHFVAFQGAYLQTIYLDTRQMMRNDLEGSIALFTDHCPRLNHLILIMERWRNLPRSFTLPASVTHLGLFAHFYHQDDGQVFEGLFHSLSDAPALQAVRFLEPWGVSSLRKNHSDAVLSLLASCTFRLEDCDGKALRLKDYGGEPDWDWELPWMPGSSRTSLSSTPCIIG